MEATHRACHVVHERGGGDDCIGSFVIRSINTDMRACFRRSSSFDAGDVAHNCYCSPKERRPPLYGSASDVGCSNMENKEEV